MNYQEIYQKKRMTPEEVASQFKSGDLCVSNGQVTEPVKILNALAERALKEDLKDIRHYILLPLRNQRYLASEMDGHIRHISHFVSGFDRESIWADQNDYNGSRPENHRRRPDDWRADR